MNLKVAHHIHRGLVFCECTESKGVSDCVWTDIPSYPISFLLCTCHLYSALVVAHDRYVTRLRTRFSSSNLPLAFAFHRTAFKDRLESLTKTLKTIDHLREYRPKNKAKRNTGGYRTPILSNLGFGIGTTPRPEKQEFITGRSRPATPDMLSEDEGIAGDIDDEKGESKKGKQRANRRSVFSMLRQNSESTTVPSRPDSPSATVSAASESHTYPPSRTPPLGVTSPSRPGTPNTRRSEDNDRVIIHAAKALKTAVLHDARNLIHHDEDEAIAGLGWSINSPREAKV